MSDKVNPPSPNNKPIYGPLEMPAEEVPRFYAGIINKLGDERDALRAENEKARELYAAMLAELNALRAENERLRAAYRVVAPICRECGKQLAPDDVLAVEQPGEDGVWIHVACQN